MKVFSNEAELCAEFIKHNADKWDAYPETAGFDILMVRKSDGCQVGVEAKMRLNAKVILQAAESTSTYQIDASGPDYRAVLVPYDKAGELCGLLPRLQITCIRFGIEIIDGYEKYGIPATEKVWQHEYLPRPDICSWEGWYDLCPAKRCKLPDYVPDVRAGCPSPVQLSDWKIRAIKIAIILEKEGGVTRADFKAIGIDMTRWTQGGWINRDNYGKKIWRQGKMPDFKSQHPTNYGQIEADYEKWRTTQ
jgi:hypothetical protein